MPFKWYNPAFNRAGYGQDYQHWMYDCHAGNSKDDSKPVTAQYKEYIR